MNKLFLMKNPDLFQGEKYLISKKSNNNYFEGWYFKTSNKENSISFIPSINIDYTDKKAFIQIITNNDSYIINYDIKDFEFSHNPFYIKIGNSIFSREGINIDIKDTNQNLIVYGNIKYSNSQNIQTNFLSPNIMGLYSYIPFMECNHAILSMKNNACGLININNIKLQFNNDIGYIEKDWGCSFPKSYIWCQGNNFKNSKVSFILSVADIPFKLFNFRGIICSLIINDKEYRFATYNNTKVVEYIIENDFINITLKKDKYTLNIKCKNNIGNKLVAPVKGKMNRDIIESITSTITITLRKNNDILFSGTSTNCGLEIVQN